MGASTGIVLTAGAISFGNEWLQTEDINFRIPIATLASALFLDGIEKIQPELGKGLATIMLITVLLTPFHGQAPLQTLGSLTQRAPVKIAPKGTH